MKKLMTLILILVMLALSFGSATAATTIPGGPFASAIMIQNLGAAEADISVQYVTSTGVVTFTSYHKIAVGDVLLIYVPNQAVPIGEYSVVLSSNQPISAISNFSDSDSGASYAGADAGSPTWYVPGVYNNYYSNYSEVYAQNIAPTAQDITLAVYAPGSATPVYTNTKTAVPSLASVNWGLMGITELQTNVPYSAKVTAVNDIVVMTNYYGTGTIAPQLYSYNAFTTGATKFFLPSITNFYYDWRSSIAIQNVSATAANVVITYSNGTTKNYTIQPNSGKLIYVPNEAGLPSGKNGLLGATVTSDQNVAVVVNQSNSYNRAASYTGIFDPTTKVSVPLLMKKYYNESSSLTCQNVGSAATIMTATFSGISTSKVSGNIEPNGIWLLYLPNETILPTGYIGSAEINATQNIACVVQSNFEDAPYNTQNMDAHKAYTGYNH